MDGACSTYGGEERHIEDFVIRTEGKRPLERPRRGWEDNIRMDLQEVGCRVMELIELARDRDKWRHL